MARNEFEPLIVLRKQGSRPPVFCLYGHTGDIETYFHLVKALGDDQPVFGIRSPALENLARLPQSMEDAAAEVIRIIRKAQPHGVPSLIGYSWAGTLAFEVARQLAINEGIKCDTFLIGTAAPVRPATLISRVTDFTGYFPPWLWNFITDHKHRRLRLARWWKMVRKVKDNPVDDPASAVELEWGSSPISVHLRGLAEKYQPLQLAAISVDVFRERDEYIFWSLPFRYGQSGYLPDGGWNRWTLKPNRIHWLEGDHGTILRPPLVSTLARAIRESIAAPAHLH
jgi:thioesterase domain-containing protein